MSYSSQVQNSIVISYYESSKSFTRRNNSLVKKKQIIIITSLTNLIYNLIRPTDGQSEGAGHDEPVRRRRPRSVCGSVVDCPTGNLDRTDHCSTRTRAGHRNGGELGSGVR